jgi:radical SAM protein with 4Fe4S-binding SPASM domain
MESLIRETKRLLFKSKQNEFLSRKAIQHVKRHGHISPIMPQKIQIQTQSHCNGRCLFCPYPEVSGKFEQGKMDWAVIEKITNEISQWDNLRKVVLMLQNEPLLDKDFFKVVRHIKTLRPKIEIFTATNGSLLNESVVQEIVECGLDEIVISLDAFSKNTYERLHPGFSFEKVMKGINLISKVKPEHLLVTLGFVCTSHNQDELDNLIRFTQDKGLGVRLVHVLNRANNVRNYDRFSLPKLKWRHLKLRLIYKFFYQACDLPFSSMTVLFNGDVILCCQDWRRQVVLGNVKTSSLSDIWNGESFDDIRRKILEKRYGEIQSCTKCTLAQLSR